MIWQIIHKQIQLGAVDKLRQVTIIFPPDVVVARLTPALKAGEQCMSHSAANRYGCRRVGREHRMQRHVAASSYEKISRHTTN